MLVYAAIQQQVNTLKSSALISAERSPKSKLDLSKIDSSTQWTAAGLKKQTYIVTHSIYIQTPLRVITMAILTTAVGACEFVN